MTVPTMQLKRRSTVGAPTTLSFGELALGDGDGLLYAGRNSGSVVAIAGLPSAYTANCVSTAALSPGNTYSNGTAGVGATLTATGNGILTIDGVATSAGQYILVTGEATGANNGLYYVTTAGAAGAAYVLTRASRMNTTDQFVGINVWITGGSAWAATLWYCTNSSSPTVGTTGIVFQCQNTSTVNNYKSAVACATTAALSPSNTYVNGSAGAGATLTATGVGILTVDGVATTAGMRILVKNEATQANNGIYTVTTAGTAGVAYVLTRTTDFDWPSAPIGAQVYVENSATNTNSNTVWACQNLSAVTFGTTAITFAQLAGVGAYTAGTGITISGLSIALTVPVTVPLGGTGVITNTTAYGVLCAGTTATGAQQNAGAGTTGQALVSGGASALPSFGTLGVAGGGTGVVTTTAYGVMCGGTSATGALQNAGAGTTGQALVSAGASALPAFGTLGVAGGGTGVVSTTAYGLICGGTTTTAAFQNAGAGTAGQILMSNGASAVPSFVGLDMGTY